jgi:hypothetical protein
MEENNMTINLKYRTLTAEAKEILFAYYFSRAIDNNTAHNQLLPLGFNLTENDELYDY